MVVEAETESIEVKLTVQDIQSWWQVAAVVHYSSVFRQAFQLPEFNFEDFEDALLKDKPGQENLFLSYLTIDILKGCLYTDDISLLVFNDRLREFLNSDAELCNDVQYALNSGKCFDDLSTFKKVCLIKSLCDCRLLTTDAYEKTVDIDADALRIEPLGTDAKGNTYWYFFGSRLYKETAPCQKPPHVSEEKSPKKKKKRKRNSKSDSTNPDFLEPSKDDLYGEWCLVASTLTEWESLAEELKQSKRSRDQELYLTISENFLPVLPSVIASEEKLRQNRLKELEETRQSARIEEKRKEQELLEAEQEAVKKAEENKKREAHRKAAKREEEEKQKAADLKRAQKEEAKALLREERQKRAAMREERASLLLEGKPIPPHLTSATLDSPVPSPTHSLDDGGSISSGGDPVNGTNAAKKSLGLATSARKRYSGFLTDDDSMDEEETNLAMMKVLSELEVHKDIGVFEKPVTEDIAPGYTSVIKNPICLEDIYKRLRANCYKSKQTFIENCLVMFENCWHYNGRLSEYGKIATDVRKLFIDAVKRHLSLDLNGGRKAVASLPTGTQSKRRRKGADQQVPVWYSESEDEYGVYNSSNSEIDSPVKGISRAATIKVQNEIQPQPSPSRDRRKQTLPSETQRRQSAVNARVQQNKTFRFWPEIDFGVKSTHRLPSLMRNDYTPNKGNAVPMTLEKLAVKSKDCGPSPETAMRNNMQTAGCFYNQPNGHAGRNRIPQAPIRTYSHNPAARVIMVGVKKPVSPVSQSQTALQQQQQQVSIPLNENLATEGPQTQRNSLGFSSPYMSKIVDVQNKEKQLTARLQQHTQETVKNFLRVARNPECNSPASNSLVFPGYIPQNVASASTTPAISQCSSKTAPLVSEPFAQRTVAASGNLSKFGSESSFSVYSSSQPIIQTNFNHKIIESHANAPVSQLNSTSALINSPVRSVTILRKSPSHMKETSLPEATILTQTPVRDLTVVNQTPVRAIQNSPHLFERSYTSNLVKNLNSPECSNLVFSPILTQPISGNAGTNRQTTNISGGKSMQFTTIGNTPVQNTSLYRHSIPQASPLVAATPTEQTGLAKLKDSKFIFVVPPKTHQLQAPKELQTPRQQQQVSASSNFVIGKNLSNRNAVMFTPLTQLTSTPGQGRPNGGKIQPMSSSTPVKIPVMSPQPTVAALLRNSFNLPVMKSNEVTLKNGDCSLSFCDKSLDLNVNPKSKVSTSTSSNYDPQKFIPRSPFANKPQKVRKQRVSPTSSSTSSIISSNSKTESAQNEVLSSSNSHLNANAIKAVSESTQMTQLASTCSAVNNNGLVNNNCEQQKTIPVVQTQHQQFAGNEILGNIPDHPQHQKNCNTNSTVNFEVPKTLNSHANTSTTYEAVKNAQAISSNEHLPLSGNPRMTDVPVHLHAG